MRTSDLSQTGPEAETAPAVDEEGTDGAGERGCTSASDPSQTGPESEVTNGGDSPKNDPENKQGPKMVPPGEGGLFAGLDKNVTNAREENNEGQRGPEDKTGPDTVSTGGVMDPDESIDHLSKSPDIGPESPAE